MKFRIAFALFFLMQTSLALASRPTWVGVEIHGFAQDKSAPINFYAADIHGLFRSKDRGISWEPLKLPESGRSRQVLVVPGDPDHLLVWHEENGFLESFDAGKHWVFRPFPDDLFGKPSNRFGDLSIQVDPLEQGGAWWASLRGRLGRSSDGGKTWALNADNVQSRLLLVHAESGSYRLSRNILFRSADQGLSWEIAYKFPQVEPESASFAANLFDLGQGELLMRYANIWYRYKTKTGEMSPASAEMRALPDFPEELATVAEPRQRRGRWYCRMGQPKPGEAALFAFCNWDNGAWPTELCIYRSGDAGRTWNKPAQTGNRCHSDLPAWSPVAIWFDRDNPDVLLMSWMAGGVYRSEDAGLSWQASDSGLRLKKLNREELLAAIHEPPLVQAVMAQDMAEVDRLVEGGVDINTPGNYVGGALDVVFNELRYRNNPPEHYAFLRLRGARAPTEATGKIRYFEIACRSTAKEVAKDLIEAGYNWGEAPLTVTDATSNLGELEACISKKDGESAKFLDESLDKWIDLYLNVRKFPAADKTALVLFKAQAPELALRVMESATLNTPLDRQSTPAAPDRWELIRELLDIKAYVWAEKLFRSMGIMKHPEKYQALLNDIAAVCSPVERYRYRALGVPVNFYGCLAGESHERREQLELLSHLNRHGRLRNEVWLDLLENEEYQWVTSTRIYKKYARHIEKFRVRKIQLGIIGIEFEITPERAIEVKRSLNDFPAIKAGLRAGDRIVAVNGQVVSAENASILARTIRGVPGTQVRLSILRAGSIIKVRLSRVLAPPV